MNIILAFVVLSIGFMVGLPSIISDSLPDSVRIQNRQLQIIEIIEESA